MKAITYTKAALRVLRRMPAPLTGRIKAKIVQYAADPVTLENNVTELKGRGGIRLLVGDWRVIMHDGTVLAVLEIGARGSVYERGN